MAARRQTPPATPTPMPTLAPVVREGEEVDVGLVEAVVLEVVVVDTGCEDEVGGDVEGEEDEDDDVDGGTEEPEDGLLPGGAWLGVTLTAWATPVEGAGVTPGKRTTSSVGAALSYVV